MRDDRYGRRARGEFLVRILRASGGEFRRPARELRETSILRAWNDRRGRPPSESDGLGLGAVEGEERGADRAGVSAERGGLDPNPRAVLPREDELLERSPDRS